MDHLLTDVEVRILGSLIEKELTTPDHYPLSLNALTNACNQTSNRDPVVHYDENTVAGAIEALRKRSLVRVVQQSGSRVFKYRHLVNETLGLVTRQTAVLSVLMLRGPQTVAELRTRSERLYPFSSADDVAATLAGLAERELVAEGSRHRWVQLLGGGAEEPEPHSPHPASSDLEARVAELERIVGELQRRLDD